MKAIVTLMIVIPLLCYVGAFWGRLIRMGVVRLVKLAAEYEPEQEGQRVQEWTFERPGKP